MATLSNRSSGQIDRRAAVEEAILRAASDLLEEGSSFAGLSVEAVAKRAGIGRTAFYFYFPDKRALLARLTQDVVGRLYEHADTWWHGEGDAPEALRRSLRPIAALYLQHSALLGVVAEAAMYDDEVRAFWNQLLGRFIEATRERIERDQESGLAAPVPPLETASALVWMAERTLYQFSRDHPGGDAGPTVEALAQVFVRAVYGRLPG